MSITISQSSMRNLEIAKSQKYLIFYVRQEKAANSHMGQAETIKCLNLHFN